MPAKPISRQRQWQKQRVAARQCMTCGKPRGEDGTATYCREHADIYNARQKRKYNLDRQGVTC